MRQNEPFQFFSTMAFVGLFLIVAISANPGSGSAKAQPDLLCDAAARKVATETGIPVSVLRAITRVETGRNRDGGLQPWAWTVNMEGTGVWFDTEDEARTYVFSHYKRGARSFDIGCFQINYRWHGQAFNSIDDMFDPVINARYAAVFLNRLFDEFGDWSKAAGAYHSRTEEFASRYIERYDRIYFALTSNGAERTDPPEARARSNGFPLLQVGANSSALGSLVPLNTTSRGSLFARPDGGS